MLHPAVQPLSRSEKFVQIGGSLPQTEICPKKREVCPKTCFRKFAPKNRQFVPTSVGSLPQTEICPKEMEVCPKSCVYTFIMFLELLNRKNAVKLQKNNYSRVHFVYRCSTLCNLSICCFTGVISIFGIQRKFVIENLLSL